MTDAERVEKLQKECETFEKHGIHSQATQDILWLASQYDAQRAEIDKLHEALEDALNEFVNIYSSAERQNKQFGMLGTVTRLYFERNLRELILRLCKALGREWGYWRRGGEDDGLSKRQIEA